MQENIEWIRNNKTNKSTAFTSEERKKLNLEGLLPYKKADQETQVARVMKNLENQTSDIERYLYLSALQGRNERLFYRVLNENIEKLLPIVYTPTVGEACKLFSHTYTEAKGFFITPEDKGKIAQMLNNWPEKNIRVIVVTDGERILGLGDLGANGMGIPIGKLILYAACGGIDPSVCLPVMIDVGTNNEALRSDQLYIGVPQPRITGDSYLELLDEFMETVTQAYPDVLVQFEDFLTPNAFGLLNRYQNKYRCFNDDIQGTASVALAGLLASQKITGIPLEEYRFMFLGAGSAATGIADLLVKKLILLGFSKDEAIERISFCDKDGLLVAGREQLQPHNLPYLKHLSPMSFMEALGEIKPTAIIGATGAAGTFTKEVIELMAELNERPVIFALSNPTAKAECTAEQAYYWSKGKAIFVSGSPFANVIFEGKTFDPGQGNNAYIFPGLGLGITAGKIKFVPDELLICAADTLSSMVTEEDIDLGALYPPISSIRKVSIQIATDVMRKAIELGISDLDSEDIENAISRQLYDPSY
ncbi:MAG: NAD-dependent malic enzyme [Cryomorphaceae bacterium]|nr:NAD-dependent malic enzyme [Cryomorphaceae bacterium]